MTAALAFLTAHYVALLSAWVVTHTLAQTVHVKCPPTTWYGKAAAVWSAINPLDVVKALNSLGAQFQVPLAATAGFLLLLAACAKAPANPPPAYQTAEASLHTAETALGTCGVTTELANVLAHDAWDEAILNELGSCSVDALAVVKAYFAAYKAEQAALAAAADAGLLAPADAGAQ